MGYANVESHSRPRSWSTLGRQATGKHRRGHRTAKDAKQSTRGITVGLRLQTGADRQVRPASQRHGPAELRRQVAGRSQANVGIAKVTRMARRQYGCASPRFATSRRRTGPSGSSSSSSRAMSQYLKVTHHHQRAGTPDRSPAEAAASTRWSTTRSAARRLRRRQAQRNRGDRDPAAAGGQRLE